MDSAKSENYFKNYGHIEPDKQYGQYNWFILYTAGFELSESNEAGVKNGFIWLEKF